MADADYQKPDSLAAADQKLGDTDIWTHSDLVLSPDAKRTVLRPFLPEYPEPYSGEYEPRLHVIVERLLGLHDDNLVERGIYRMTELIGARHRNMEKILLRSFDDLVQKGAVPADAQVDDRRKLLIGAFFNEEYSFEAAALFNPSIVRHWDQSNVPEGSVRFLLSLRGIGEGHVSSVTFRTGTWNGNGDIVVDAPSTYAEPPTIEPLHDGGDEASLCLTFEDIEDISEAVLFPMAPSQRQGIEDLRLVHFTEDDGATHYVGTYTAFSGSAIRQEILSTEDFRTFRMQALEGKFAQNKGMALFPRRVDGRYTMLGRLDNESIFLMRSDKLYCWDEAERIVMPHYPWEFVQIGNCGSPIEIDEGWLVMIHGVGMVRNYSISACLLDKKDPSKLLGRTRRPLLRSAPDHRDGYVPNVVYSCGSLVMGRKLLLPYGVADNYASFSATDIDTILSMMD